MDESNNAIKEESDHSHNESYDTKNVPESSSTWYFIIQIYGLEQSNKRRIRKNGFNWPPNKSVIFTWSFGISECAFYYIFYIPFLLNSVDISLAIIVLIIGGLMFITLAFLTVMWMIKDPTDPLVKNKEATQTPQEYECLIWESYVSSNSKHCKSWNRWVVDFDHHWRWLNNWIGHNNYRYFFWLISLYAAGSIFLLIPLNISCLVKFLKVEQIYTKSASITLLSTMLFTKWVIIFLVLVLLVFHIYIRCKGMTTFEFILQKREELERRHQQNIELHDRIKAELEVRFSSNLISLNSPMRFIFKLLFINRAKIL